jgi:hypothetical protein
MGVLTRDEKAKCGRSAYGSRKKEDVAALAANGSPQACGKVVKAFIQEAI